MQSPLQDSCTLARSRRDANRSRRWSPTLLALAAALSLAIAETASAEPPALTQVASFAHQVTGVAVSKGGRIFVNFPRWTEDNEVSVGELKNGQVVPFPDTRWNAWRNAKKDEVSPDDHWVCVQSVVADGQGNLWVLDAAAPAMGTVVEHGPKLVRIDLTTDRVTRDHRPRRIRRTAGAPYMNDVRFAPDGSFAYITDSGAVGALVVVDLATGSARRVLHGHPTTQPDKNVAVQYDGKPLRRPDGRGVEFAADGLALSPDGATLYWQAIKGKTLYSVPTRALRTPGVAVGDQVAPVGENGPADGLIISRHDGKMYVSSPQDDSIRVRDLAQSSGAATTILRDSGCAGRIRSRRDPTVRSTSRPPTSRTRVLQAWSAGRVADRTVGGSSREADDATPPGFARTGARGPGASRRRGAASWHPGCPPGLAGHRMFARSDRPLRRPPDPRTFLAHP